MGKSTVLPPDTEWPLQSKHDIGMNPSYCLITSRDKSFTTFKVALSTFHQITINSYNIPMRKPLLLQSLYRLENSDLEILHNL